MFRLGGSDKNEEMGSVGHSLPPELTRVPNGDIVLLGIRNGVHPKHNITTRAHQSVPFDEQRQLPWPRNELDEVLVEDHVERLRGERIRINLCVVSDVQEPPLGDQFLERNVRLVVVLSELAIHCQHLDVVRNIGHEVGKVSSTSSDVEHRSDPPGAEGDVRQDLLSEEKALF